MINEIKKENTSDRTLVQNIFWRHRSSQAHHLVFKVFENYFWNVSVQTILEFLRFLPPALFVLVLEWLRCRRPHPGKD